MKNIKLENNSKQKLLHEMLGPYHIGSRTQPCSLHIQIHADSECTLILCKLECSVWGVPYICPYASHMYSTCSTQTTFLLPLSLPLFYDVLWMSRFYFDPSPMLLLVLSPPFCASESLRYSVFVLFSRNNVVKRKWKSHLEDHN